MCVYMCLHEPVCVHMLVYAHAIALLVAVGWETLSQGKDSFGKFTAAQIVATALQTQREVLSARQVKHE